MMGVMNANITTGGGLPVEIETSYNGHVVTVVIGEEHHVFSEYDVIRLVAALLNSTYTVQEAEA